MYQIGENFTRIKPNIAFDALEHTARSDTSCVLGDPPPKFASVHSPGLLNTWYHKLQAVISNPVETEQRRGHRRVQVLGSVVYDFASNGILQVFVWGFDENDQLALLQRPDQQVIIHRPLDDSLWLAPFKQSALRALRQCHPGQAALTRAYVQWADARLLAACWTTEIQDRVRYQTAVALDLDLDALAVASQIQRTAQPELSILLSTYNLAITYAADFATLKTEAPDLLVLFGLLADDRNLYASPTHREATAWMRRTLKLDGIKPAMWRLLCREGTDWMKEFLPYFNFDQQDHFAVAYEILYMTQAFGTRELMPLWMLHAFCQLGGTPNSPQSRYFDRLHDLFPLCARLGHLWGRANETDRALLKEHVLAIWDWASDHLAQKPRDFVRRVSLRGLIKAVQEQQALDLARVQLACSWTVPYQLQLEHHAVEAVILDSQLAIWQEARTMRHCADRYIQPCAEGRWVMVSLRSPHRERPLATIAFDVHARAVKQVHISGFGNSLVSPEVREMALKCRRQLQKQRRLREFEKQIEEQEIV